MKKWICPKCGIPNTNYKYVCEGFGCTFERSIYYWGSDNDLWKAIIFGLITFSIGILAFISFS